MLIKQKYYGGFLSLKTIGNSKILENRRVFEFVYVVANKWGNYSNRENTNEKREEGKLI